MRVLIVHNRYRSAMPSGENRVVEQDVQIFEQAGVHVESYVRDSDEIETYGAVDRLALATRPFVSVRSCRDIDAILRDRRPDVVHLHNPYPLISPAIVPVARRHGVPIVQTVHNYRHTCADGTFFRDGHVCVDCDGRRVGLPAVQHACYRGSRPQSAVMVGAIALHRRTWRRIDRLLPVSPYVRDWLVESGFDPTRVAVHPNAVADPGSPLPLGDGFAFLGRLDEAKGVRLLVDAWDRSGLDGSARLVIAGDGPLRPLVEDLAKRSRRVEYRGAVSAADAGGIIDDAAAVVVPSLWYEALPMTILEAFSRGRPVVTANAGALATLVDDETGFLFEPSADGLAATLVRAHRSGLRARSAGARRRYERLYTPDRRVERALEIYDEVIRERRLASKTDGAGGTGGSGGSTRSG